MSLIGAVEAGGTKFVLAVFDCARRMIERGTIPTRDPAATFAAMLAWFGAAQERHGPIGAFGIASFGPLDLDPGSARFGSIASTPKPGWNGASLLRALEPFAIPAAIDTDVNGAALGEWLARPEAERRTLAYTTVGTGIGTGVIHQGKPLAGIAHYEAGHLRPARPPGDDWPGICPYHGDCLEGLASGPAIEARWGHDLSHGSAQQMETIAFYLAEYAATLATLHAPHEMIFGGGVMKVPGLLDAVRRLTGNKLAGYMAAYRGDLDDIILPPALGDDAGITGAFELGLRALQRG